MQCFVDCHCGVNQFCGIDSESSLFVPSDLTTSNLKSHPSLDDDNLILRLQAQSFSQLPLKSKCYDIQAPSAPCAGYSIYDSTLEHLGYQSVVTSSTGDEVRSPWNYGFTKASMQPTDSKGPPPQTTQQHAPH